MAPQPANWPLQNRSAEACIDVGQPERAVEVPEKYLVITGYTGRSTQALQLLELANQKLEELGCRGSNS